MLKYAHKNGCDLNDWSCVYASKNDNLEILKYLYENGCKWDERVC